MLELLAWTVAAAVVIQGTTALVLHWWNIHDWWQGVKADKAALNAALTHAPDVAQ